MARKIKITTFENPHKFWFIDEEDEEKCKELQVIINEKALQNLEQIAPIQSMECIAFHKSNFKRAIVKNIRENIIKVWLMDYGIIVDTTKIFKITNTMLDYTCYVKQASLSNVIPSTSRIHYQDFTLLPENLDTFTPGAIKFANEQIAQARKITFLCETVYKDIHCGEIFLYKDEKQFSLNNLLINANHCLSDKEGFKKLLDAIAKHSQKEIVKEILHNILEEEEVLSEGIGRATSRMDFKEDVAKNPSTSDDVTDIWNSIRPNRRAEINIKPPDTFRIHPKTHTTEIKLKHATKCGESSDESNQQIKFENTAEVKKDCANKTNPKFQLGCQCDSCSMWNTTDLKGHKLIFESQKTPRTIVKPKLLFKNIDGITETMPKIHSILESHRHLTPTILTHGYSIPVPIQSVAKIPFNTKTERILQLLNFKKPKPIQVYSWPTVMRKMNVFVANGAKTGKTMVYVPPLVNFITEKNERYRNLPPENGPIILIVCSNCNTADSIYALLTDIFHRVDKGIKVFLGIPPFDKQRINQFQMSHDVLVTTPLSLLNLLQNFTINLKRLCHLVFEQIDVMLDKLSKEVYTFLNTVDSMLEHRTCGYPVQLIFTAESWTTKIENLFRKLQSLPLICIGQPLEATIYGKPDIQMHFTLSQKKKIILGDILRDKENYYKTLIVCDNEHEIKEIERYVTAEGKSMIILTESMPIEKIKEYEIIWQRSKNNSLYICTDVFLKCYFNITDVGCLIHYNLSKDSWTSFCKRFCTLLDNFTSPFAEEKNAIKCKVHVFVDETCEKEFPKLQNFLLNISHNLPESFKERCQKIYNNNELHKIERNVELCSRMLTFGSCTSFNCPERHNLNSNLENGNLPTSGTIYFRVSNIIDAATYGVHLLEHIDLDTETSTKIPNLCKDIENELSVKCMTCKMYPSRIKLSAWYVWEQSVNEFKRVEVIAILEEHHITKEPHRVKIELIDYGGTENIPTSQLYELPEKFKRIPKQVVIVRLANFLPAEKDMEWPKTLKTRIKTLFEKNLYDDEDSYFSSRILLTLGNNVWVKDMYLKEVLHVTDVIVTKFSLKDIITKRNYGIYTEEPLNKLYALCEKFHITLPKYEIKVTPKPVIQAEPNWAFFEDEEYNKVYFSSAFNSDKFYVRLAKFENVFRNYQKEIQCEIHKPLYKNDFDVVVGKYYLAKDLEGPDYCRIKITDINKDIVNCFYVDFGDTASVKIDELKYLTDGQIQKLPFQAIECGLCGTTPITDDLQDSILDILYNYAFEPNTDYFRTLYAKVMETTTVSKRSTYSIILCDNFKERPININKLIIDSGLAICSEDALLEMKIDIPRDDVKTSEECDEDIIEDAHNLQDYNNADECDDFDDDEWDLQMSRPEEFLSLLGIRKLPTTKAIENSKSNLPEVTTTTTVVPQDSSVDTYYSPDILWHQSDAYLKLEILLADVQDYTINLHRGNIFFFKTMLKRKDYQINITLFDDVEKTFQHVVFGQYIRVTMKKITNDVTWPRLTLSDKKMRNIRYDYEKDIKPEPKPKPFLTIDVEASDDENQLRYEIGSDEDYDESDIQSNSSED